MAGDDSSQIQLQVLEDKQDNRILECAMTGKAGAIVIGDKGSFTLATIQAFEYFL